MKKQYTTILNKVIEKQVSVDQKSNAGFRLFERKHAIQLARPSKDKGPASLRLWL